MVERATRDLMAAEFGLGGYEQDQLKEIFDLLRGLRLTQRRLHPRDPEALNPEARRPRSPGGD